MTDEHGTPDVAPTSPAARMYSPESPARVQLGEMTWHELRSRRPLLVVPVGSCEQHGPHLPLDTDTRIAVALAERLCTSLGSRRPETNAGRTDAGADAVVAPAVTVTASGEHHGFPGTLSIGTDTTVDVLVELIRSADWTDGVVLVNGHGGNLDAVRRAVDRTTADGRRVLSWWPRAAGGDAHAGFTETSLLLAIAPHLVRVDRVEAGRLEPVHELMDELRRGGVRAVSTNGVLGDATGATAEHGRRLLDDLTVDLVATVTRAVDGWRGEGST